MNERLRLSTKKQAIQATRRLQRKHKEELQSLRHQIEVDRSHAQRRHDELIESTSQQLLVAQSEKGGIEQRMQTILLEKQTVESEMDLLNERVKEIQKRRFNEWTSEHETLMRAHNASMKDLEEQKRHAQMQINEASLQKDAAASKEIKYTSLERERVNLLKEIKDMRHHHAEEQADLKTKMTRLQEQYYATRDDLHASRNETSGLRSLLKQCHSALQTVSFREVGQASANANMMPSTFSNRGAVMLASQSRSRETPKPRAGPSMIASPARTNIGTLSQSNGESEQQVSSNNTHPSKKESLDSATSGKQKLCVESVIPEDPPCSSAEDPPEMTENGRVVTGNDKKDAGCVVVKSLGTVVGEDFFLNLSAITEEVRTENGFAAASASNQEKDVSPARRAHTEMSPPRQTNNVDVKVDTGVIYDDAGEADHIQVDNAQSVDSHIQGTEFFEKSVDSNDSKESPEAVDESEVPHQSNSHPRETSRPSIAKAQVSTASMAPEAMKSEHYSECFDTFDEGNNRSSDLQGNVPTSPDQHDSARDSFSGKRNVSDPESPLSESSADSSGGYTESFCSEPL